MPDAINSEVTPLATISTIPPAEYTSMLVTSCDDVQTSLNAALPLFMDLCGFTGTPCTCTFDQNTDVDSTGCTNACDTSTPVVCDSTNVLNCDQVNTCGRTGPVVCGPPPSFDPPPPGVVADLSEHRSTLEVDPSVSIFNLQVNLAGDAGPPQANVSPAVHGRLTTFGLVNDDGTADVQVELDTTIDDTSFTVQSVTANLTEIKAYGGALSTIHVDALGVATIQKHDFKITLDVVQNGSPTRLHVDNDQILMPTLDFAHKTFSIPTIPFDSGEGITGNFSLSGKITNQPPHARTTADQVLECTSPAGATVTLDGSPTTDPDGDLAFFTWSTGAGFDPANVFAHTATATTIAPLGAADSTLSTLYTLDVGDTSLQTALASTITVRDTTAPTLTMSTPNPACLWPPNKDIVLYQLGSTFGFNVTDACDTNPTVTITNVTSDQPGVGEITFGPHALCLESDRDGSISSGRHYTVTLQAQDHSGNMTTKTIVITVPHDQSGTKCPHVDKSRVVSSTDSRCTQ